MKTQNTPENPALNRALAVLRAGLGIVPTEPPKQPPAPAIAAPVAPPKAKPQAQAKKPAKVQPARDVWYYLTKNGRA